MCVFDTACCAWQPFTHMCIGLANVVCVCVCVCHWMSVACDRLLCFDTRSGWHVLRTDVRHVGVCGLKSRYTDLAAQTRQPVCDRLLRSRLAHVGVESQYTDRVLQLQLQRLSACWM
jgi:hypothetical protein